MKESLYIENFGPIKKAELDLRQVIVLIGPQSSGKSAIAKLISILRDWRFVNQEVSFETLLENFNVTSFLSIKTVITYNSRSHGFSYEKGTGKLIFNNEHQYFQAKRKFEEYEANNPRPEFDAHSKIIDGKKLEVKNLELQADKESDILKKRDLLQIALNKISEVEKELEVYIERLTNNKAFLIEKLQFTNYSQYIPAERLLVAIYSSAPLSFANSNLPIPKNILEFAAAFEQAKLSNTKYKIPFLNYRYSFENGTDIVYYSEKEFTKLKESSSGLQTLIPMLLVIIHRWAHEYMLYSFVIEEPEQNLYPLAQQKLIYYLANVCLQRDDIKDSRSDLVVTTHSPYVLTSFNNLLFANLVAQTEENKEAVSKFIPEESRINAENFNAYYVADGGVEQIFNRETGMIDENQLDNASEEIMHDFNLLMDIYKKSK